jgi:hypothetical protein
MEVPFLIKKRINMTHNYQIFYKSDTQRYEQTYEYYTGSDREPCKIMATRTLNNLVGNNPHISFWLIDEKG